MSPVRRLALCVTLAACIVPAGHASAAVRVFPGCGATLADCIASAPAGATIRLKTNHLVRLPADGLEVTKPLSFRPAAGYRPKVGRAGDSTYWEFAPTGSNTTVSFRGITFRQVSTYVEFLEGTGHHVIFANNTVRNDSGSNGDSGISVYYSNASAGSISITRNDISSSGAGIEARVQDGAATIIGNLVTSPVSADSQAGINVYGGGSGPVRATVASNLIHGTGGCGCGTPAGIQARAFGTATFDLRILNNTLVDLDPATYGGVVIVDPYSDPAAQINASLYNNTISGGQFGIVLYEDDQVEVLGDRNNTFDTAQGDIPGSYDLGTTLHVDPGYVDDEAGDFRLDPDSALKDGGRTCISGVPLPRGDASNRFRLHGWSVDVGAFERGSSTPAYVSGRNLSGTDAGETLTGARYGRDILCGLGGNDELHGLGRGDFLFGGDGDDEVWGDHGHDRIDTRDGVSGNDGAYGGPGDDLCRVDTGDVLGGCP